MPEYKHHHLFIRLENFPRGLQVRLLGIQIRGYSVTRQQPKAFKGSHEIALDYRRGDAKQNEEYRVNRNHHLKDVVDDPEPAHEGIVKQDVVIEDAQYSKQLTRDCHHRHSGEKQEGQQYPTQHRAHLTVEVVRQDPVGNLHRADRTNILEPISPAEVGMPAGPAHKGLRDEVPNRKCIGFAVVGKRIEFVALLPVRNPDLLVTYSADQDQIGVEMNVVLSQFGGKFGVASKIVIVIADHHGDLDARPGSAELIENGLVCRNYVIKLFDSPHEGEFPETERIADY